MGMVKKPFLFALLARFLHSPILHYADSLWIKKNNGRNNILPLGLQLLFLLE